jgi:poly(A) polymerase
MPAELEAWWRGFQSADPEARKAMLLPETGPRKRRRRRRKKSPSDASPSSETT